MFDGETAYLCYIPEQSVLTSGTRLPLNCPLQEEAKTRQESSSHVSFDLLTFSALCIFQIYSGQLCATFS